MNILVISKISNNLASGISNVVPCHIRYLAKEENVIWYNLNENYKVDESLRHIYHSKSKYGLNMGNGLLKDIDIVIFHGVCFWEYGIIAKKLMRKNIPYIIVPHGSLTEYALNIKPIKKKIGIWLFMSKFVTNAKAIQYLSNGEKDNSKRIYNKNTIVIGNGIETKSQRKTQFGKNELRGIYIGRLMIHNKGIDLLFDACEQLKDKLYKNKIKVDIFGPEDNKSRYLLEKSLKDKGLEQIITINEGIFGEEKIQQLLKSDFFILTSRSEGQPCSVIEAMAFGIPCLVTEGTNIADEVITYNAGWSASNDVEHIKAALEKLIMEKGELETKGYNAWRVAQTYRWEYISTKSINEYKRLIF